MTPALSRRTATSPLPTDLTPGVGGSGLHIGQSEANVVDVWGHPKKQEQHNGSNFYLYPKLGLEIEFENSRVERLFFYPSGRGQSSRKSLPQVSGIRFGASANQVLERFGPPTSKGEAREVLGQHVRAWLCYSSGIQFEFDKGQKLALITIFRPETPKKK